MNLDGMNPAQLEATTHIDGPCCVIAGAGSGKTRVLTHRIAYLIEQGVPAEQILACTFTRKAASEMTERLEPLVGREADLLNLGTIHSMCYRILREEWRNTGEDYEILNDYWQKRYVKDILAPAGPKNPDGMNWGADVGDVLGVISKQKNELVTAQMFQKRIVDYDANDAGRYARAYELYEERKQQEGKLDFDDMLIRCYYLLAENPVILAKYQERYKYILVDEFQDTNHAQWEIIRMLADPEANLFVVGDDWQSIYGFRGARPEYIVNFQKWYPEAEIVVLDTNYRSNSQIINVSNAVIQNNQDQYPKTVLAHRDPGREPMMLHATDEEHEAELIVSEIQTLIKNGTKPGEIAILYRTNSQSRAFEDKLVRANISYTIVGSAGFYGRKEVKHMIGYLQVIADTNNDEAVKRILNVPNRFLGRVLIQNVESFAIQNGLSFYDAMQCIDNLRMFQKRNISEFVELIEELRRHSYPPAQTIQLIRELTEYDAWLKKEDGDTDGENARIENLNELQSAASRHSDLTSFLQFVEMMTSRSQSNDDSDDRVQLMTIHRSKGLEYPAVFLTGMVNDLLPHKNAVGYVDGQILPNTCTEERRLCYVGMTRARDLLYMSYFDRYQGKDVEPSIFLTETAKERHVDDVSGTGTRHVI
ncbi:ATP-dependent helicase [Numidum massiliense]|uniref:ATP-dependent helicase n=1 Tax=Numidum massiliense TaxID=1522315 RepID=UPI0006D5AAC6|nr:ATP-dependent helicase [Numidum massiliense]